MVKQDKHMLYDFSLLEQLFTTLDYVLALGPTTHLQTLPDHVHEKTNRLYHMIETRKDGEY
jgi:hypothetical protein